MYQYKNLYVLDFSKIRHFSELHEIIKEELDFPDYYGKNWDAFWDCLTDMVGHPVHIEIHGIDQLEQQGENDAKKLIKILKRLKHYNDDRYVNEIKITLIVDGQSCELQ